VRRISPRLGDDSRFQRAFLALYQPYVERAAEARLWVTRDGRARADAWTRRTPMRSRHTVFVIAPFGRSSRPTRRSTRLRRAPRAGDARRYLGWCLRNLGHLRDSLEGPRPPTGLDALDPMSANMLALARMAARSMSPKPFPCSRSLWSACPP
jgi:hypothetical protein